MQKQNNKVKPIKPLTEEEKKARIIQFLQQKREQFAIMILQGICSNPEIHAKNPVEEAVEMADRLLEKLYPINND